MSVNYKAKMIYDAAVENITKSEDVWKDICRMAGQLYRYEFQNILLVYEQRPGATLVADYDTWKKVDRYVRRGSKGIAILPSRALQPYIRYVFDVGDTGGKEQSLTWNLEGDNLKDYLMFEGVAVPAEADRKLQFNLLKAFTKRQIRGIIKEDFAERMTQLNMLAGRVITDHDEETPELAVQRLVTNSILYAVGTRCGFSLSSEEQDLSLIVNISGEDNIYALGSLVCDVSCTVLRSMNQSLTQMENDKAEELRSSELSEKFLSAWSIAEAVIDNNLEELQEYTFTLPLKDLVFLMEDLKKEEMFDLNFCCKFFQTDDEGKVRRIIYNLLEVIEFYISNEMYYREKE